MAKLVPIAGPACGPCKELSGVCVANTTGSYCVYPQPLAELSVATVQAVCPNTTTLIFTTAAATTLLILGIWLTVVYFADIKKVFNGMMDWLVERKKEEPSVYTTTDVEAQEGVTKYPNIYPTLNNNNINNESTPSAPEADETADVIPEIAAATVGEEEGEDKLAEIANWLE